MKQTAVEWLDLHLLGLISFDSEELRAMYKERIQQAKEMEKQQECSREDLEDSLLINLIKLNERAIKENWKMKDVGFEFFKVFAYSKKPNNLNK